MRYRRIPLSVAGVREEEGGSDGEARESRRILVVREKLNISRVAAKTRYPL